MWIELTLAWLHNLTGIATLGAIVLAFMVAIQFVGPFLAECDDEPQTAGRLRTNRGWTIVAMIVCLFLCSIPSPQHLWEVRVALLKLAVASPENLKAGQEHLSEVIKSLECKHLGLCPEKEANKP